MEVKIEIPDNCELIKEGDSYIVRERPSKPKSWEKFRKNFPTIAGECYIDSDSDIIELKNRVPASRTSEDRNLCINKEEAEAFLALMQLRQLRKAWVGDWEITDQPYYCIIPSKTKITVLAGSSLLRSLSFPTKEMAEEFLNCFRDLCETAKILL